jgi:hypothetical protein
MIQMPGGDDFHSRIADPSITSAAASTADTYMKVRQARAQNSVVLQIEDGDVPARVLPLPAQGQSVFVSTLLKQTGVVQKIGGIEVTLYRSSPDTINGLRMNVKMSSDGKRVSPDSDYALQAGDRIRIRKRQFKIIEALTGVAITGV